MSRDDLTVEVIFFGEQQPSQDSRNLVVLNREASGTANIGGQGEPKAKL